MNTKSDLLLINSFSWTEEKRPCYLPYGILYLAGYVRDKGLSVDIYDRNCDYSHDIQKCISYFEKKKPKIVGLSVLSGPVINDALKISRKIKLIEPETVIIWGGLHPTLFSEYVAREPSVDFIVHGEGEEALHELCDAILNDKSYESIANIGFLKNDSLVLNPMRKELLDLDKVPFPAWDLVDMKYYLARRFFGSRVLTMNTSRGCVFKCTFCFNQGLDYQSWRAIGPERMHAQLQHLYEKYNINGVQFYEDSFDINPKRCKGFSDLMINSGLNKKVKWSHFANIPLFKRDVAIHEKKAGMVYIEFGVESGSDRILNWIDKSQSVEKIKEVYEECRQLKIKTAALFIIGFPEESEEEIRATEALVENLPAYILICTIYRPYPGTPLYDYCTSHGIFAEPKNIDEQGEFYRFSHMSEDELNLSNASTKTLLRLQRKFYAKSAIKDLMHCLKTLNFGLVLYYVKLHLNPKVLMYSLDSLMKRVIDKSDFAKDFGVAKSRNKYKLYGNFDGSLEQLGFDKVVVPSSRENSKMVLESERDTVFH